MTSFVQVIIFVSAFGGRSFHPLGETPFSSKPTPPLRMRSGNVTKLLNYPRRYKAFLIDPYSPPGKLTAREDNVPPMASFDDGYHIYIDRRLHDKRGHLTTNEGAKKLILRLNKKVQRLENNSHAVEARFMDDAKVAIAPYGTSARASMRAVALGRAKGIRIGWVRLKQL